MILNELDNFVPFERITAIVNKILPVVINMIPVIVAVIDNNIIFIEMNLVVENNSRELYAKNPDIIRSRIPGNP